MHSELVSVSVSPAAQAVRHLSVQGTGTFCKEKYFPQHSLLLLMLVLSPDGDGF